MVSNDSCLTDNVDMVAYCQVRNHINVLSEPSNMSVSIKLYSSTKNNLSILFSNSQTFITLKDLIKASAIMSSKVAFL